MGSVYEIILDNIITHIEKGTIPWRSGLKKHFNGFNKREYRGINQILLSLDTKLFNYSAPIWFSFKQAKELGCSIKKGAKSSFVVFSKRQEVKKEEDEENDSIEYFSESESEKENKVKKKDIYYLLRYYRVFNIDDVEGIDKSKYLHNENETKEKPEQIVTVMEKTGLKIDYIMSDSCYIPSYDKIRISPISYFESSETYYNTLFHEIIHATGHQTRLNRKSLTENAKFGSEIYSYEELVAEIGASFLMGVTDLNVNYENSSAYIKGWSSFLKDNKKAIFQASSDARKSVDYVMEKLHNGNE